MAHRTGAHRILDSAKHEALLAVDLTTGLVDTAPKGFLGPDPGLEMLIIAEGVVRWTDVSGKLNNGGVRKLASPIEISCRRHIPSSGFEPRIEVELGVFGLRLRQAASLHP
jgi:hypothetical protein